MNSNRVFIQNESSASFVILSNVRFDSSTGQIYYAIYLICWNVNLNLFKLYIFKFDTWSDLLLKLCCWYSARATRNVRPKTTSNAKIMKTGVFMHSSFQSYTHAPCSFCNFSGRGVPWGSLSRAMQAFLYLYPKREFSEGVFVHDLLIIHSLLHSSFRHRFEAGIQFHSPIALSPWKRTQ